jgi:hypothetical protein
MKLLKQFVKAKRLIWSTFLLIILVPLFGLVACTSDRPYRTSLAELNATTGQPSGSVCAGQWKNPAALDNDDPVNSEKNWGTGNEWTCALQKHEFRSRPNMTSAPKAGSPSTAKSEAERRGYHLAFLEFGENGRFATDPEHQKIHQGQLRDLQQHLSRQKQNYLIVFVHGWRHDANRGDDDIKDLRLMAAYARSFLNQRCDELGRYCDASVTALYVGWRGASVDESYGVVTTPATFISLFNRKPQSEQVAASVVNSLRGIWNDLSARNASHGALEFNKDRMLVLGHSLGGNMLLTGLSPTIIGSIAKHMPSETIHPPLGNLVVLLNPAAEASKWIALQNAVHQRDAALRLVDESERRSKSLFRQDQKPTVIALTSACGLSTGDGSGTTTNALCDQATNRSFPLYRRILGYTSVVDQNTVGHIPLIASDALNIPKGSIVGPTHRLDINQDGGTPTRYEDALDNRLSRCDAVDGWLVKVRQRAESFGRYWDAGVSNKDGNPQIFNGVPLPNKTPINAQFNEPGGQKRLESQIRHGVTGSNKRDIRPASSGHDPFWNVKAHTGAIREHSGYVSYKTWCAINQFVMDDITARR